MDNAIYHHGIKGMRWGVRRFQRKDGRLTPAGKKRVASVKDMSDEELTSSIKRLNSENVYKTLTKSPTKAEKTKKVVDATSTLVSQAQKLNRESMSTKKVKERLDLSKMTDQQLRERINRHNLERQYNDLFASEKSTVSKGQRYLSNVLEVGGSVLAITGSSLGIALAIKELRG